MYRWIRQGTLRQSSPESFDWEVSEAGTLPPGQANEVAKLHKFWMGLWKPDAADPNPDLSAWLGPLRRLTPFPNLRKIQARLLRRVVKKTASNKAPGSDGWAYTELKDWPHA